MDVVHDLGVDINAPASESRAILSAVSISQLMSIRDDLYREATVLDLTTEGDELVSRRSSRKNPLNSRLAEDVIALVFCLKNETNVPRTLLKNGKRNKDYLNASRIANLTPPAPTSPINSPSSDTESVVPVEPATANCTLSDSIHA